MIECFLGYMSKKRYLGGNFPERIGKFILKVEARALHGKVRGSQSLYLQKDLRAEVAVLVAFI